MEFVLALALVSNGLLSNNSYPRLLFLINNSAGLDVLNSARYIVNLRSSNISSVQLSVFCDRYTEPNDGWVVMTVLVAMSVSPNLDDHSS